MPEFSMTLASLQTSLQIRRSSPIRLRAHSLLCLQGFRGHGYSVDFVQNMSDVHRTLYEQPDTLVEVVDAPDALCGACPHHALTGCSVKGQHSEREIVNQDHVVLNRLELKPGSVLRWRDILERIPQSIYGSDLPSICGACPWLLLGVCAQGIDALRDRSGPHE